MNEISEKPGADRRAVLRGAALLTAVAIADALPLSGRADATAGGDSPVARTTYGAVRGSVEDGINVFRGVPYGAPTGGEARFIPPEPPVRWGNVRDARRFGDQCPQLAQPRSPLLASWDANTGESEDCLSLNVWTPGVDDGKKRPVMVWLHGGGFSSLSGASPVFDGVRLCQRGDVVLVTINHRLNLFGYLYLAELGGAKYESSGNIGQLDQIAALQWVRDNIEGFGGDPDRVTIFGQGGGGRKVSTLLAMPAAKGLFHRAVIQSGPGLTAITPDAGDANARALMAALGASKADDLQHAPADRLLDALDKASRGAGFALGPVVDGSNVPHDPFSPTAPQISADVPVIVGYTATETTLGAPPGDFDLDWPDLRAQLAPVLAGADADRLIADFRRLRPTASASDLYFTITTEVGLGRDSILLAERKGALGAAPAYMYRLEFETAVDRLRSPQDLDLPLVFDTVDRSAAFLGAAAGDARKVVEQMSPAWIAFARTGSPNAPGLPSWPRYDTRSRSTLLFNVVSRAVNDPYAEERRIIAGLPAAAAG
jgi:para-nitrobenzyl esterase